MIFLMILKKTKKVDLKEKNMLNAQYVVEKVQYTE